MAKKPEELFTAEQTKGYLELNAEAFSLMIDAYASANRRTLDYLKSMYEIVSRPYNGTAIETNVRDNFDRSNQIVSLTVSELQATAQHNSELLEKTASFVSKWQETALGANRGLLKTVASNISYVKETTEAQVDEFTKRMEKITVPVTSNN
jgi:hypothetical protein